MNTNPQDQRFFEPLIQKAKELIDPERIILFGSFARGDFGDKSDIDLAFKFDQVKQDKWAFFKDWVSENFKTLRDFDLVNIDEADQSVRESVQKEGKVLYER